MIFDPSAIQPFLTGVILVISAISIVEIIILIRWLYIKLNYLETIDAKVIGKYGSGRSSYSHTDYSSNYSSLSKGEADVYELEYTIDGVEHKAMLQGLSIYTKKGDIVKVKYHKNNHNKIVAAKFFWGWSIALGLFLIAWVAVLIFVLNIKW